MQLIKSHSGTTNTEGLTPSEDLRSPRPSVFKVSPDHAYLRSRQTVKMHNNASIRTYNSTRVCKTTYVGKLSNLKRDKRIQKGYTLHIFKCHAQKTRSEVKTEAGWASERHCLALSWEINALNYTSDPNKVLRGLPAIRGGHRPSTGHQNISPAKCLANRPKM